MARQWDWAPQPPRMQCIFDYGRSQGVAVQLQLLAPLEVQRQIGADQEAMFV